MNVKRLCLAAALLALGGCSAVDTVKEWTGLAVLGPEPMKLEEFPATAAFSERWHVSLGESGANPLQPALTQDAVYGVSARGELSRLERATGKLVWRAEGDVVTTAGVGSGEGLLVFGSDKGDVLAYGEDGKQRWRSKVSSEVLGVPQIADGIVVVRSGDAHITGLSASTGKRLWVYERSTPALVVRSHASVAIVRGMVFAGFAAGKLVALKLADGSDLWETNVSQPRGSTELERISDITSTPVINDMQICVIAFQGNIGCYDAGQGSPLWTRNLSGDRGLSISGKNLYLTDADGSVVALDKVSGSTLWKNDQLLRRAPSLPLEQGSLVVVGDLEGYLHGLNRLDGRMAARIKLDGSAILAAPQAMDDGLLVQTRGGELYALTLH